MEDGVLQLQPDETLRHDLFKFYVEQWAYGNYATWEEFVEQAQPLIDKKLARDDTRLASNLQTVLGVIKEQFPVQPAFRVVLLYFHREAGQEQPPVGASNGFELVCVDCSAAVRDNFAMIAL